MAAAPDNCLRSRPVAVWVPGMLIIPVPVYHRNESTNRRGICFSMVSFRITVSMRATPRTPAPPPSAKVSHSGSLRFANSNRPRFTDSNFYLLYSLPEHVTRITMLIWMVFGRIFNGKKEIEAGPYLQSFSSSPPLPPHFTRPLGPDIFLRIHLLIRVDFRNFRLIFGSSKMEDQFSGRQKRLAGLPQ